MIINSYVENVENRTKMIFIKKVARNKYIEREYREENFKKTLFVGFVKSVIFVDVNSITF